MKKSISFILLICCLCTLFGCASQQSTVQIVASTKPVYDFAFALCQNTGLSVSLIVTENLSCLHDYTLQVQQMQKIEAAQLIVISGAGLEDFLDPVIHGKTNVVDASMGIDLHCSDEQEDHDHAEHHHAQDPHIWLSLDNARSMCQTIYSALVTQYPEFAEIFQDNMAALCDRFDQLDRYGQDTLESLSCRDLITFHDGFHYFADYWGLNILHALEEESGSEASAGELIEIIALVEEYQLPAIFTEENGSSSAASIVATETGISVFALSMAMSDSDYFDTMQRNIDVIKEALG